MMLIRTDIHGLTNLYSHTARHPLPSRCKQFHDHHSLYLYCLNIAIVILLLVIVAAIILVPRSIKRYNQRILRRAGRR